ncbi:MAG: hypothetical protein M1820_003372 [Bogoriella megaspora]|nr:MAG: hypothetical protein M1820_003372 [Bogoriella megaspora]
MDTDSMEAVLKLFVEDLEELIEADKGKTRLGSLSETQVVHLENLNAVRSMLQIYSDRKIASSMNRACQDDAVAIRNILTTEEQAASDHDLACRLAGLSIVPRPASKFHADLQDGSSITPTASDDEDLSISDIMEIFSQVYGTSHESERSSSSEKECSYATSSKSKGSTPEVPVKRNTCISCRDDVLFFDTVKLPCDPDPTPHYWCRDCIVELFQQATTDEQLHPPRCCRVPIELEDVKDFLSPALLDATIQASIEFSAKDRLYCWQPTCSKFIPMENRDQDIGTCLACFEQTCVQCKQKAHQGTDCPMDPSVQALMAVAEELEWRQCGRCHRMIELTIGCYHME